MNKKGIIHIPVIFVILLSIIFAIYLVLSKPINNRTDSEKISCLRTPERIHEEYNYYSNPKEFKFTSCEFPPGYPKDTFRNLDLTSCIHLSNEVYVDNTTVYKRPFSPGSGASFEYFVVKNADPETFVYLGHGFYKDKNNIFYDNGPSFQIIKGLDAQSFDTLTVNIIKDKNGVYAIAPYEFSNYQIISELNPETLRLIRNHGRDSEYYKDDEHIYTIDVLNDLTVSVKKLEEADYETFEFPYESSLPKDKNYVFYKGEITNVADPDSFEQIGPYFRDHVNVYNVVDNELVVLNGMDGCSFELVSFDDSKYDWKRYSKDKNNVYYGTTIIEDADPESFVVTDDRVYDKNYEFSGIYKKINGEIQYRKYNE